MRDRTYLGMRQHLHQYTPPPDPGSLMATFVAFGLFVAFFLWAVFGHPTPAERERVLDSTGHTTGVNWR